VRVCSFRRNREPDRHAPLVTNTEINPHAATRLHEDDCGAIHDRLLLYKRLAN